MNTIEVTHLAKAFGSVQAVDDVSFSVATGEIFGLLGPNGAGKTTIIRLLLDILRPDRGTVTILGGPMTEAKKDRIGYMPEERGLYQEMQLESCLLYLAQMKGMEIAEARRRLARYLERFDLARQRQQKVKALSRGMQQKAQIISTVLPHPELLIVDEPFSGLDPVNTRLAKELLQELRAAGTTVIMSTHMMHQVEELCDRILLINHGRNVLYGELAQIRHTFSGPALTVRVDGKFPSLTGVRETAQRNGARQLALLDRTTPEDVLQQLAAKRIRVTQFEIAAPTLDEIFIQAVTAQAGTS